MNYKKLGYIGIEFIVILSIILLFGGASVTNLSKGGDSSTGSFEKEFDKTYNFVNVDRENELPKGDGDDQDSNDNELDDEGEFLPTDPNATVFAIYSESDNSLRFYNNTDDVSEGNTYKNLKVTKIYRNFTDTAYASNQALPWYTESTLVEKVVFEQMFETNNIAYWFKEFVNCNYFNVGRVDTSEVTDMSYVFYYSGGKEEDYKIIGLENWNTKRVTTMANMFCAIGQNATNVSLGNIGVWNTESLTNTSNMFNSAAVNVERFVLDLKGWNTSSLRDMQSMFDSTAYSSKYFSLDMRGWDTSSVTNMICSFCGAGGYAYNWEILGMPDWDVSNVTDMRYLLYHAGYNVKDFKLDLNKWNTSNVTQMRFAFYQAGYNSETIELKIDKWDVSKVTNMSNMFYEFGLNASYTLDLSGWDVSKCKNKSNFATNTSPKLISPFS